MANDDDETSAELLSLVLFCMHIQKRIKSSLCLRVPLLRTDATVLFPVCRFVYRDDQLFHSLSIWTYARRRRCLSLARGLHS